MIGNILCILISLAIGGIITLGAFYVGYEIGQREGYSTSPGKTLYEMTITKDGYITKPYKAYVFEEMRK